MRILLCGILLATAAHAGQIEGTVVDALDGVGAAGVQVLAQSPGLAGDQIATTDHSGRFRFVLLPPGIYRLTVIAPFASNDWVGDLTLHASATLWQTRWFDSGPGIVDWLFQYASVLDLSTTETGYVTTRAHWDLLPGPRGI